MVWLAIFLSLLSTFLVGFLYWHFRKQQEVSVQKYSDQVSGLLSEFNSVTSSKVELLDDRTDELRRVVDRAEMKIEKLETLIEEAEAIRESLTKDSDPSDSENDSGANQDEVVNLAEEGLGVTEIAERTDLTPGEISVILKVNDKITLED